MPVLEEFSVLKVGDPAHSLLVCRPGFGRNWTISFFCISKIEVACISMCLSLSDITGVLSRLGGNHGEAVAVCDAGSCHGSAWTDLPKALRVSDPFTQPGNPLCQERPAFRAAQH